MPYFLVLSEPLEDIIDLDGFGNGPYEPYAQCEVIEAKTREQARWEVYKAYKWFDSSNPSEMPRYHTHRITHEEHKMAWDLWAQDNGLLGYEYYLEQAVSPEIWERLSKF